MPYYTSDVSPAPAWGATASSITEGAVSAVPAGAALAPVGMPYVDEVVMCAGTRKADGAACSNRATVGQYCVGHSRAVAANSGA